MGNFFLLLLLLLLLLRLKLLRLSTFSAFFSCLSIWLLPRCSSDILQHCSCPTSTLLGSPWIRPCWSFRSQKIRRNVKDVPKNLLFRWTVISSAHYQNETTLDEKDTQPHSLLFHFQGAFFVFETVFSSFIHFSLRTHNTIRGLVCPLVRWYVALKSQQIKKKTCELHQRLALELLLNNLIDCRSKFKCKVAQF